MEVRGAEEDHFSERWFRARVLGRTADLVQVVYTTARARPRL